MNKAESFALNMRLYRALVFQWAKDENNETLRKKVFEFEDRIINSVYPEQNALDANEAWKNATDNAQRTN